MFLPWKNSGVAPEGATPMALTAMTLRVLGFQISAWVSPPQPRVSHIVQTAASMAEVASTALPPFWNIMAPAVAPRGLPVMAIQWRAWSGGLLVRAAPGRIPSPEIRSAAAAASSTSRRRPGRAFMIASSSSRLRSVQEGG